jgi:hypothetical protein
MKNELIQELAKRAHEDVRSDEEANGVCFKDYDLQFQKAFAKLLILECAEITDGLSKLFPRTDIGFDVGYTMGTTRATKEIKKHFGVTE